MMGSSRPSTGRRPRRGLTGGEAGSAARGGPQPEETGPSPTQPWAWLWDRPLVAAPGRPVRNRGPGREDARQPTSSNGAGTGGAGADSSGVDWIPTKKQLAACSLGTLPARPSVRRAGCPGSRPRGSPGVGRRAPRTWCVLGRASGARGPGPPVLGGSCRLPPDPSPGSHCCLPLCVRARAPHPQADVLSHTGPFLHSVTGARRSQRRSRTAHLPRSAGPRGGKQRSPQPAHRGTRHPRPRPGLLAGVWTLASASPREAWTSLEQPRPGGVARTSPRPHLLPPRGRTRVHGRPGEGRRPTGLAGRSWGGVLDKVPAVRAAQAVTEGRLPRARPAASPARDVTPRQRPRASSHALMPACRGRTGVACENRRRDGRVGDADRLWGTW